MARSFLADPQPVATLVSAAAGDGVVAVDWTAPAGRTAGGEIALYAGRNRASVFDNPGQTLSGSEGRILLQGLDNGTDFFLSLGSAGGGGAPRPLGPVLRVRPGPPIYVDIDADPAGDGTSAGTPTPDIVSAVFTAFLFGGGNVWVAAGDYNGVSLPVFGNVHVYGGFPKDFELAERDPSEHVSRLLGIAGQAVVAVQTGVAPIVIDGFQIDGRGSSATGVNLTNTQADLRALDIWGCARGVKLLAGETMPLEVVIVSCVLHDNTLQGLSTEGAFDLRLEACRFELNGQEGADLGDLIAPDGGVARLVVRGSRFAGNVGEGLDVDLNVPLVGGVGGRFEVDLSSSDFDANGLEGLLVDIEFDAFPGWSADIVVRGCRARANLASGLHFDMDQRSTLLVHRVACSGNAQDGLLVSSETASSMATLSSSSFLGNRGAGVRARTGNVPILATHCVFAGNAGGGMASHPVESAAVSCVAHLQPAPWSGVRIYRSVEIDADGGSPFLNAPVEYGRATAISGANVSLAAVPSVPGGATIELDDDGVTREAVVVSGASLVLDAPPGPRLLPATVAFFSPGADAVEDFRPTAGSPVRGVGMAPPFAPPTDAGVFGSPMGGDPGSDGRADEQIFRVSASVPAWGRVIGANDTLTLTFVGGTPDPASVTSAVHARDAQDQLLGISVAVSNGALLVLPPPGGWPASAWLELHSTLRADSGMPLVPVALPIMAP